jgi:hypothetical protein
MSGERFSIWVPAFAGMSGIESVTPVNLEGQRLRLNEGGADERATLYR